MTLTGVNQCLETMMGRRGNPGLWSLGQELTGKGA